MFVLMYLVVSVLFYLSSVYVFVFLCVECVCFSCVCVFAYICLSLILMLATLTNRNIVSILIPKLSDLTFASRKTYAKVSRRDGETSRPQRQSVCYSRLKEGLMFTLSSVNKIENVLKSTPDPLYPDARIHMRESAYT